MKIIQLHILLIVIALPLYATPELALYSGNRCSECHLNSAGSGMRSEFGWTFGKDITFLQPKDVGLEKIYSIDKEDYSWFNGLLSFGRDFRYQSVRSHKSEDADRKYFPMQAAIYLGSEPFSWLQLEFGYNFGPKVYYGQQKWTASATIKPADWLPYIRFGRIEPSFGLKNCDMTMFDRRVASSYGSESLIPPAYYEYGAEIIYESIDWLTFIGGVYDAQSLREVLIYGDQIPLVKVQSNPSFMLKYIIWPTLGFDFLTGSYFGMSGFANGDFWMADWFAGASITEEVFLEAKVVFTDKEYARETLSYIGTLTYSPLSGIFVFIRGEHGETELMLNKDYPYTIKADQAVAGIRSMLLPYIEILAEYRYLSAEEFTSTRWALQLHLYY